MSVFSSFGQGKDHDMEERQEGGGWKGGEWNREVAPKRQRSQRFPRWPKGAATTRAASLEQMGGQDGGSQDTHVTPKIGAMPINCGFEMLCRRFEMKWVQNDISQLEKCNCRDPRDCQAKPAVSKRC